MRKKPLLSFWQLWNMSFGYVGIQFGFALQNANVSRIFETLGAKVDDIPILWIAAPRVGPAGAAGHRLHERQDLEPPGPPETLLPCRGDPGVAGAAGHAQFARRCGLPRACSGCMDASINVTMEPMRAFVGDMLPDEQRTTGIRGPDLLHRRQLRRRLAAAVHADELAPFREHGARGAGPRLREVVLLPRRRRVPRRRPVDDLHREGIFAGGAGGLQRARGRCRGRGCRGPGGHAGFEEILRRRRVCCSWAAWWSASPSGTSPGTRRSTSCHSGPASTASCRCWPRSAVRRRQEEGARSSSSTT